MEFGIRDGVQEGQQNKVAPAGVHKHTRTGIGYII